LRSGLGIAIFFTLFELMVHICLHLSNHHTAQFRLHRR
jgi:hypothetical protein